MAVLATSDTAAVALAKARLENKVSKCAEVMIQLDVKKAFSRLDHLAIVKMLVAWRMPGNMVRVINEYLQDRKVMTAFAGEEVQQGMACGVPQGSPVGMHLYTMATAHVVRELRGEIDRDRATRADVFAYADDIVLLVSCEGSGRTALQRAVALVETAKMQLAHAGLELAVEKTNLMVSRMKTDVQEVNLAGTMIEPQQKICFLGVWFDAEQTPMAQVAHIEAKVDAILERNKRVLAKASGLSYGLRQTVAKTVILPAATYGAGGWLGKLDRKTQSKLRTVSKKIALSVTMAPDKASYAAAVVMSKMLPVHWAAWVSHGTQLAVHQGSFEGKALESKMKLGEKEHPARWKFLKVQAAVTTNDEVRTHWADVNYATDGSKYEVDGEVCTGAAYVRYTADGEQQVQRLKLDGRNSVFQAELYAIKAALLDATSAGGGRDVTIYSDSLSALSAIAQAGQNTRMVVDCQKLIRDLSAQGGKLKMVHVKAHVGVEINEEADRQAKEAAKDGEQTDLPLPYGHLRATLRAKAWQLFNQEYHENKHGSTIKQFVPDADGPLAKRLKVDRYTAMIYSGTGYNIESNIYGYGKKEAKCECGEAQTMLHLITSCVGRMDENIRVAKLAGMTPADFCVPWEQLREDRRVHTYIQMRARDLDRELRQTNSTLIKMNVLAAKLWYVHVSDQNAHEPQRVAMTEEEKKEMVRKALRRKPKRRYEETTELFDTILYSDRSLGIQLEGQVTD